jgi:gas vesicle protein
MSTIGNNPFHNFDRANTELTKPSSPVDHRTSSSASELLNTPLPVIPSRSSINAVHLKPELTTNPLVKLAVKIRDSVRVILNYITKNAHVSKSSVEELTSQFTSDGIGKDFKNAVYRYKKTAMRNFSKNAERLTKELNHIENQFHGLDTNKAEIMQNASNTLKRDILKNVKSRIAHLKNDSHAFGDKVDNELKNLQYLERKLEGQLERKHFFDPSSKTAKTPAHAKHAVDNYESTKAQIVDEVNALSKEQIIEQIDTIEEEINRIVDRVEVGVLPSREDRKKASALDNKQKMLQARLNELNAQGTVEPSPSEKMSIDQAEKLIDEFLAEDEVAESAHQTSTSDRISTIAATTPHTPPEEVSISNFNAKEIKNSPNLITKFAGKIRHIFAQFNQEPLPLRELRTKISTAIQTQLELFHMDVHVVKFREAMAGYDRARKSSSNADFDEAKTNLLQVLKDIDIGVEAAEFLSGDETSKIRASTIRDAINGLTIVINSDSEYRA